MIRTNPFAFIVTMLLALTPSTQISAQCVASFTWTQTAPNVITFTNTSSGYSTQPAATWIFDSYLSTSNQWSPTHTFLMPGTHHVTLQILDSLNNCNSGITDSIVVTGSVLCNMTLSHMVWPASCPTCQDGYAGVSANNGQAPFTYLWSNNSASNYSYNQGPGSISVCVMDAAGCQVCDTMTIGVSTCTAGFTSSQTAANTMAFTNTSTNAATAAASWDFGDGNYSAQVSPTHFYNVPGIYRVSLNENDTANGCLSTFVDSITVTGTLNCNLSDSLWHSMAGCSTCFDGNAYVTVFGGTPPYSFLWSNGETGLYAFTLGAGPQWVQITDANFCQITDTFTMPVSVCTAAFTTQQSSSNVVAFSDASANLTSNPSYFWDFGDGNTSTAVSPVHTYNASGTYPVILFVQDSVHNCWSTSYTAVHAWGNSATCSTSFTLTPDTLNPYQYWGYNNTQAQLPVNYLWSWGDSTTDTAAYPVHTYANPGLYTISLTIWDSVSCYADYYSSLQVVRLSSQVMAANTTITILPGNTSSVPSQDNEVLYLFPNPAGEMVYIGGMHTSRLIHYRLYSMSGTLAAEGFTGGREIPLSSLAKGLYELRLTASDGTPLLSQRLLHQ